MVVALSGILLTLLIKVFLPGIQIWKQTQAKAALEQKALLCELRVTKAFRPSSAESVAFVSNSSLQAASCLSHEGDRQEIGFDPVEGKASWRSMTIFKLVPSEKVLKRLRWKEPPLRTTDTFHFTPTQLIAACGSGLEERKVADSVVFFQVTRVPERPIFEFEIGLETNTPRGPYQITKVFTVTPRIQGDES